MLHPVVTEICSRQKKIAKLAVFSKFRTHDLKVLSPNYEKTLLLSIGNIAAKFEDVHPVVTEICSGQKSEQPPAATGHNNSPKACRLWVNEMLNPI